jgi:hypothetical protein
MLILYFIRATSTSLVSLLFVTEFLLSHVTGIYSILKCSKTFILINHFVFLFVPGKKQPHTVECYLCGKCTINSAINCIMLVPLHLHGVEAAASNAVMAATYDAIQNFWDRPGVCKVQNCR